MKQALVPALALIAALAALLGASGCRYPNCDNIVDDRCVESVMTDSGLCSSNSDCAEGTVCDIAASRQCVQCTPEQPGACGGATPTCGTDHRCRACEHYADCAMSDLCLPGGLCAATADTAYVAMDGSDSAACTRSEPCARITAALATGRPFLKLSGTIDEAVTVGGGRVATIFAEPDAILTRSGGGGPALTVRDDDTSLTVHDLVIADLTDNREFAIYVPPNGSPSLFLSHVLVSNNAGGGISITTGSFTMVRSIVSNNTAGGLLIDGDARFVIVGNAFLANGSPSSATGALYVSAFESPSNRLEFNTFYKNAAQAGIGAAINCFAGPFTARNNIMSGNGSLANMEQVGGGCQHAYSIVRPGTLPMGPGNMAADPLFKNLATRDVHLDPRSPAAGAADPASNLTELAAHDLDGIVRAPPATIGAYQIP